MDGPVQKRSDARIARARALAADHPAARELLSFYADLTEFLSALVAIPPAGGKAKQPSQTFREALDGLIPLDAAPRLRHWLSVRAPAFRGSDASPDTEAFITSALIQPFAEHIAAGWPRERDERSSTCPICGARPVVAVFRPEGHGSKRALVCCQCLTEHEYRRVLCPWCGEDRFDALPVFTADQFPHVRIDACDSCHTYIKTIDLTKDGLAEPLVDDLATAALDVWAREHGYERGQRNLLEL